MIETPGGGLAIEMWQAEDGAQTSDLTLQDDVWAEIHRVLALEPGALTVDVSQGVAALGGTVASYAQKVAATEAAARTPGIRRVESGIVVEPAPRDARSDDALQLMVQRVLSWDSAVPPDGVNALVRDGEVILTGTAVSDAQRAEAEAAVTRLIGVRGVINRIALPSRRADSHAIPALQDAIAHRLGRDGRHVQVGVRDGAVTLTGRVCSLALRKAAEAAVRQVLGDVPLNDGLVV